MATELETFAAHARTMTKARHRPDCPLWGSSKRALYVDGAMQKCDGCVTDEDRVRWAQLAAEADARLRGVVLA